MALPDAATKLRMVLDYLPCEACLAQPVEDQDLLCTICARLDRQVAVRVGTRTTVLVERPALPEAPVVIPPAVEVPQPEPAPPVAVAAPREIALRMIDEPPVERPGAIEVVLEPVVTLPPPAPLVAPEPEPEPQPIVAVEEPEPDFDLSDLVDYVPAREQFFEFTGSRSAPAPPPPAPEPEPEPAPEPVAAAQPEPAPQDDYVFRPPPAVEEPAPEPAPELMEELFPAEEVPLESAPEEQAQWAPPAEEEEIVETAVDDDEVLDMEVVEDEDVVEMEIMEDDEPAPPPAPAAAPEPAPAPRAPAGTGDLYRLRGFDAAAEGAFAKVGITEVSHLSGHDAGELATRTGIPLARVQPWVQVADLVQEVGVPMDAAIALVAAGVAGPRGLRDADPDEVADRVAAFGGYAVKAGEVKRWKRRA